MYFIEVIVSVVGLNILPFTQNILVKPTCLMKHFAQTKTLFESK